MNTEQTYFHIGYARAASTFLQKTVFPALTGIQYIPRNRFRVREKEKKRFKSHKVLMSREAGKYIYERVDDVKRVFGSKVIISLRRHDSLAASTYRLQAKNGHTIRFPQFLDLKDDLGVWKQKDFMYMDLIRYCEQVNGEPPIVLIFEDYIKNPKHYLTILSLALECGVDEAALSHKPVHKSYTDKQLRLRRQFADKYLPPEDDHKVYASETINDHTWWRSFKHRAVLWFSGIFMRLARFAPDSWLNDEPLIYEKDLDAVKQFYQADWQACRDYVDAQNERLLNS